MKITMAHGSGGKATSELIQEVFAKEFENEILNRMEDSALVKGSQKLAMTTDSFVVTPIVFPGGDIGHLSICGTVNDLLMSGARPQYLTCGFIIEEGTEIDTLKQIAKSMAKTAKAAGIMIVAGDTKVIEGNGGIYINTAGVGFVDETIDISSSNCENGDIVILSGNLGDHHATILSSRLSIENTIKSDCAPLNDMVENLLENKIRIKAMRDVTRGGLGTVLNEFATASSCTIELQEEKIPVSDQVKSFCKILGLDPFYMANEGKMVAVVSKEDSEKALELIRNSKYGENAAIIGSVTQEEAGMVFVNTLIGGKRKIDILYGEGLPRIC
ncbi:hydrogenase expression/formation protein HypE [Anaerosacchariphilus polymeriproducens]|uniref:Hydrogenase expression/formation protein HypE n=1 Tax=Anaerosacchariphilus polymeriproducens TaxID=1812858 RepID=A0A371ATT7_9FIRM|nr:hydrogenase expression/formation protein HypE [Anaerosacchariphilus polymeriproducens]RDU22968.1 hydrogenase expression/formation protein HypE [Anaerosacchariphilus polymeriproducens]